MVLGEIIEIDKELCDGCGDCIPLCEEEALEIFEGKARLVNEEYCDGLGACIESCPQGAIKIIKRESKAFNEKAATSHMMDISVKGEERDIRSIVTKKPHQGTLRNFPVKLELVSVNAPFFNDADILFVTDCVPFAYPGLHKEFLPGRVVIIGCPKLDDVSMYVSKLKAILKGHNIKSLTSLNMEIPCCSGVSWILEKALEKSCKKIPVRGYKVSLRGDIHEL